MKTDKQRECNREYMRKWRAANPEQSRARDRDWQAANLERKRAHRRASYATNIDKNRARGKAYRVANPEKVSELNRAYRVQNADKVRAGVRAWQKANPDKKRESDRAWRDANRETIRDKHRIRTLKRRATIKACVTEVITTSQLTSLLADPCIYCGDPSEHIDHCLPLARGGTHTLDNLVPACAPCNLSKGSKLPGIEWFGRPGKKSKINLDSETDLD